jgi:Skp family chaperone for outer membrane proteins
MKLPLLLSLVLLTIVPAFAQSGPQRIAVLDVNQVLSESSAGQAVYGRLKAAQNDFAAKADKLEAEIQNLLQDFGTHQLSWSETQIDEKNRAITDKRAALERFTKDADQKLGEMRDRELQRLEEKIKPVIEAVAAEKNLDAVFSKTESSLLFASDRIDITHDVISRFNTAK